MADIHPFPLRRLVGKARHVAALIARKQGRDRDTYFRMTCQRLANSLRKVGFDEHEVAGQIAAFTATVNDCIGEGWHYPVTNDDLAEAHRVIDEGMTELHHDLDQA